MNRNPLNLSKPERLFIGVACLLGVILDNGSSTFIYLLMPIGRDMAVTWGILRISGNLLLATVFAFIIYRMIGVYRHSGFTYKKTLSLFAFVVFILFLIAVNIWRYTTVMNFNQYLETSLADTNKSILSKMNQNLPPEDKSKLSFLHARAVFTDEGRIIEYLSPEGKSITFAPSAEDQSNRNLIIFQQTQSGSEKMIASIISLSWLIALLGAFIFGFTAKKSAESLY